MTKEPKHIVIIGGGFAGTKLARSLQRKLPENTTLTLMNEESYTTFNPMLPEAVGASIFPEHVVAPLRQVIDTRCRSRFIMGRVTDINCATQVLACTTLAGELTMKYTHLVCAFGSRARTDFLPGMEEHALPLKTVGDAMEIRNTVLKRLARIELESDPALRRSLGHFIVIGGGFSGVEVAGELIDSISSILRYYSRVKMEELQVSIVQDSDALLPELPASLGRSAQRSLHARGVKILLNKRAKEISPMGVELMDGESLIGATIICTIGTRPNLLTERLMQAGASIERGRIVANADLSVPGVNGVWAVGDCAQIPNALDNKSSPPTAQFAVQQAKLLAKNLTANINGEPTRPFHYRSRGMMAAIGHKKGVAQVLGLPIGGLPAWLIWRAYYLSQMPTFGRKLRIWVEWTWGMFFPADITHLRFMRSTDINKADAMPIIRAPGTPPPPPPKS